MGRGVIYKCIDGKRWEKTTVMDTGNTSDVFDEGKVRHCDDGNKWYDNYPMEAEYEKYFSATWSQGYGKNGVKLDDKNFGDHPRAGDTEGYIGMWGFDNAAMKSFVENGLVLSLMINVNFADPTHAGNPSLIFGPHIHKTKPNAALWSNINQLYTAPQVFTQTGDSYSKWIYLPTAAWLGGDVGGIAVWAASNIATNYARFSGISESFNTRIFIKVRKDFKVTVK